jgi:exopolysaccharide biosynthesis polyprenyl glycosylphosphotransferase
VIGVCVHGGDAVLHTRAGDFPIVGEPDDIVVVARRLGADSVAVVGHGRFVDTTLQQVAWQFERSGIDLLVAPDVADLAGPRIRVAPVTGVPLLHITEPRIGGAGRFKGWYERAIAVPLLVVASPLLLLIAVAVLINSGRPVLYRQKRVGYGGREFTMLKFRTMVPDAERMLTDLLVANEHDGALFKVRSDPRITRVGRWLRKYSLDELPQLINVVKGDMVLVGPRPCLAREVERFGEAAHRRFLAKPGLTGLWQVSGRCNLNFQEMIELDLTYIATWSPWLDLLILLRTPWAVVSGKGAY